MYDKTARFREREAIRRQIGEVDTEIKRLDAYREEIQATQTLLTTLEAVLRRMSMLARESAKLGDRRPGILEEYEDCKETAMELARHAVVDGRNILGNDASLDDMMDLLDRCPG